MTVIAEAVKEDQRSSPPGTALAARATAKTSRHLYAGFVSGLTSAVILQPFDLLKTRVQQNKGTTLKATWQEIPSFGALWRGTVPSALRTSVGSALYFTSLTYTRQQLAHLLPSARQSDRASSKLPSLSMQANLASGAFVRGMVGFMTMPITVVKVRYESSMYNYSSIANACKDIWTQHGVRGFFTGLGVTFARDAPYAGIYVLFYEKSKDVMNRLSLSENSTSSAALINSSSAMFSATAATTLTGPFDTIKTRMQIDPDKYRSFANTARIILAEGGVRDLFDGLSLRLARKAMSAGIAWCIYEELVRRA